MKIVLIRHGKTEGNIKKRYIGKTDEPLCETASLCLAYPECDAVIASPMKRCLQTAEFIYPDNKVKICPDLRECDFGDFENKSYEDLKDNRKYIEWLNSGGTLPFPNGEAHSEFVERCVKGFQDVLRPEYKSVAYVIHGGTIMAIMQSLFGGDFYDYQLSNGSMVVFNYDINRKKAVGAYTREESE